MIMYEIMYHNDSDDMLTRCSVLPIEVLEEKGNGGILAKDHNGNKFLGRIENYYKTEKEAWDEVRCIVIESMNNVLKDIIKAQRQLLILKNYQKELDVTG